MLIGANMGRKLFGRNVNKRYESVDFDSWKRHPDSCDQQLPKQMYAAGAGQADARLAARPMRGG